jgi:hypothetical protein
MADPRLTAQADNLIHDIHIYRSGMEHFVCNVRLLHKTNRSEDAVFEAQGFAHRLKSMVKLPDGLEGDRKFLGTMTSEANSPQPLFGYTVMSTRPCNSQEEVSAFAAGVLFNLAEATGLPPSELLKRVNPEHDTKNKPEYLSAQMIAPYLEGLSKQRMH